MCKINSKSKVIQNLIMPKIDGQCQRFTEIDSSLVSSCCKGRVRVLLINKKMSHLTILPYIAHGIVFCFLK